MLIFIYSRKSLYTEKGKSIENQIEMCKEYVLKNIDESKLEDIAVYEDEGFSGKNTNRPQFQKMIEDSKKLKPDYIVCYKLDRISRSVIDFSNFLEDISSKNISFICIKEQFDTSTPMGRAMMYIASVFAQLERETIAERIRDNMLLLSRTGIWLGGNCPTGFTAKRKMEVIIDGKIKEYSYLEENNDIEAIKLIFDKFLKFGSARYVSKYLANEDIKTVNGINYFQPSLDKILQNPVYCTADKDSFDYFKEKGAEVYFDKDDFNKGLGIMPFNRRNLKFKYNCNPESKWVIALGRHKGVISGKDWVSVQKIFSKRKSITRTYCSNALLSGLVKCENCGDSVLVRSNYRDNTKRTFYHVCRKKDRLGKNMCNMKNLNGPKTDEYVINYIMNFDENKLKRSLNIRKHSRRVNKFSDDVFNLDCNIKKLQIQKDKYIDYLNKITPSSPLLKDIEIKVGKINAEIDKLNKEKNIYKSKFDSAEFEKYNVQQIIDRVSFFKKNFHNLDFDAKNHSFV